MKAKRLKLPKVYEVNDNTPDQYKKFEGVPKLSYSAIMSFTEPSYRGEFFQTYFLGERSEGNVFTKFGGAVGEFLETGVNEAGDLSVFDKEVLTEKVGRPYGAVYEKEIVIDRGSYCIQGFIDRILLSSKQDGYLDVLDFKTGSIVKKRADYASDDYQQTTLYSYALEESGLNVASSGVLLLDRKGNGQEKYPIGLTGEIEYIPTPYSRERADRALEKFDKVALEIEEYFRVFTKYLL